MHFRERTIKDSEEVDRLTREKHQATIWTALPAIITKVNFGKDITVEAVPTVQGTVTTPEGAEINVTMPACVDVPVCFQRGGGYTLTFPVKEGDECLLIFSSRCIDGWWSTGGTVPPTEQRMHDLSDGFALVGPFSQKTKISKLSTTTAQLRSDDGTVFVEIDHEGGIATVKAPTKIVLDSPLVHTTGKVTSVGDVIAGTVSLQTHVQLNTQPSATGVSGPPRP